MWSKCHLTVVFKHPLHFEKMKRNLTLPATVEGNSDGHYDLEAGACARRRDIPCQGHFLMVISDDGETAY